MSGCRVFIGRLSPHARERDVEKFFKGYGRIREINLKNGFGFVEFDDHRDADDAVYELNGKVLCSERVTIEHARNHRGRGGMMGGGGGGRYPNRFAYRQSNSGGNSRYGPPVRTEHRIIVENLSSRVSWQDLKGFMRKAGEVTYVDAHRSNRNEGVVEFASYTDMKSALDKLDGVELSGRKIKLVEDSKKHRSRSRSRSRSHSRSRSKSKSRGSSKSVSRSRSKSRTPERKYSQKNSPAEPAQGSSPRTKRQSRSSSADSRN
ncbi:serine/arginine-rich splicing factor 5 alpha L homeolog [Xenopus laevis]|uniref:Serine/arginine-rich splicing factor 5 n=1 Tax=Xenopus laevis TaxID=8355 RepID=Q7ZXX0_XENLA|nr:serine/arginine-rich splicing factor 5 alpha L homeolog [Xenopus laevis]AAH44085.1 MGC52712 protein [Xenopus laevis]